MTLDIEFLDEAVGTAAALRRRRRLQPAGGPGDKVFPPTYPAEGRNEPPRHVFERRRLGDREAWCVLLDSVQSQANRMEEALLRAAQEGCIELPRIVVDFASAGLNTIGEISSLEAPHRVFDAILRDSLLDGQPFLNGTKIGKDLKAATIREATKILEVSPTALLFGAWNSTGEGGGLGAKFPRAIVSEIIGVDGPVEEAPANRQGEAAIRTAGRRTGSRIDPLGILRSVTVYKGDAGWDTDPAGAGKGAKQVRPSEINHGNVTPSVSPLGVTFAYAEQTVVITLAGLRRLSFGEDAARNRAARALLASLGLVAITEQDAQGYALRSRCDLVCDGPAPFECVAADGTATQVELTAEAARALYAAAYARAREVGFTLDAKPLRLTPQPKLVEIVRQSMARALADQGTDDDADD
jgi:CRISPR-associated protein Csb1